MTAEKDSRTPQEHQHRQLIDKEAGSLADFYDRVKGLAYHDSARFDFPSAVYSRNTFVTYQNNKTERITTAFVRVNKPAVAEWLYHADITNDLTSSALLDQLPLFAIDRMGISQAVAQTEDTTKRTDYTWTIAPAFRNKLMEKEGSENESYHVEQFLLTREAATYTHSLPQSQKDIAGYLLEKQPGLAKPTSILPQRQIIQPSSEEIQELLTRIDTQWADEGSLFRHVSFFEFHASTLPEPPVTEETI